MPHKQTYDEKELLLRISEDDQQAFARLIDKYSGTLRAFVANYISLKNHNLVDEVVCDVFMQVWLTRETLPSIRHLGNYLFILARNKGLNALKKELREQNRRQHLAAVYSEPDDLQQRLTEDRALGLIDQAVLTLPLQQQRVWILSRKKFLSYAEIASELGISKETVKSYLQTANQSIKKYVLTHLEDWPATVIYLLIFFESGHPFL